MKKFTLEIIYTLAGIGSSSGLFFDGNEVFIVSDNASQIYSYEPGNDVMYRIPLFDSVVTENIPKKEKPDLESLAYFDGKFYAFGSGSTPKRNHVFICEPHSDKALRYDLTLLYENLRAISGIDEENFNIEGALNHGGSWHLFQRGNGLLARNGFFRINGALPNASEVFFTEVSIPDINGFPAGFTDAVLIGNDCYFLASAEDSASTYEDGAVSGSAIGKLDLATGKVLNFMLISDTHKFEGLTVFAKDTNSISFLLCEDNDSDFLETKIYKLTLVD